MDALTGRLSTTLWLRACPTYALWRPSVFGQRRLMERLRDLFAIVLAVVIRTISGIAVRSPRMRLVLTL